MTEFERSPALPGSDTRLSRRSRTPRALLKTVATLCVSLSPALAATVVAPVDGGSYQGVIVDWPKGQKGTLKLTAGSLPALAEGTVDEQGRFTIALPAGRAFERVAAQAGDLFADKSLYRPAADGCRGQGQASPAEARVALFDLTAFIAGKEVATLKLASTTRLPYPVGQLFSQLTFLDRPATADGVIRCSDEIVTFKGSFPAGWILPAGKLTGTDKSGATLTLRTADDLPASVVWRLYDEFIGVGVTFTEKEDRSVGLRIEAVTPRSPAERGGMRSGDVIVQVDGKSVIGMSYSEAVPLIRGAENTEVILGVRRAGTPDILPLKVVRGIIQVP